MSLPTIRQLQYLVAVVELCHFGRAAERCCVTQSTLSTGIGELEVLLGVQLLERTKRKVVPTPSGLKQADYARQVLALVGKMEALGRSEQAPLVGPLRLGVIPTIGPFLLPQILPHVRAKFPELQLYLVEDQSARLLARLDAGQLDCAIMALPYPLERHESRVFASERFWVAYPSTHAQAEGGAVDIGDLPLNELLLLEEGHCMREHALSVCQASGKLQAPAAFQSTSLYTLIEMVAGGQGITLVPEMALAAITKGRTNISLRPLNGHEPHREIGLVWRTTYDRKRDIMCLADYIASLMEGNTEAL